MRDFASNNGVSRRDWLRSVLAGVGALSATFASSSMAGDEPRQPLERRIYVVGATRIVGEDAPRLATLIAIDVDTGEATKLLDACELRPRISLDGRRVAYSLDRAIWLREIPRGEPLRVCRLRENETAGPPCWSRDGKKVLVSLHPREEDTRSWLARTLLVNADGSGHTELPLSELDHVLDWSADGQWLLTRATRDTKQGPQIFVMRTDGTEARAITSEGLSYDPRFSPDGRRVVYTHGASAQERGIWVVDVDGSHRRELLPTGAIWAFACWSPDGNRIAVAYWDLDGRNNGRDLSRVEVMNLAGENRKAYNIEGDSPSGPPDWR